MATFCRSALLHFRLSVLRPCVAAAASPQMVYRPTLTLKSVWSARRFRIHGLASPRIRCALELDVSSSPPVSDPMAQGGRCPQQGRMMRIASALGLVMFSVALLILSLISYVSIKNSPRSGLSGGPRMFHAGARWVQVGLCCSCWLDAQWALSAVLHKKQVNLTCTSMNLLMWYLLCLNRYKYLFDNLHAHVYSVQEGWRKEIRLKKKKLRKLRLLSLKVGVQASLLSVCLHIVLL